MRISYTVCGAAIVIGFLTFVAYLSIAISPDSTTLVAPVLQYTMSIIGCELLWGGMLGFMATSIASSNPSPGIFKRFAAAYLILISAFLFFNAWYLGYIAKQMLILEGESDPDQPIFSLVLLGLAITVLIAGIVVATLQILRRPQQEPYYPQQPSPFDAPK